MLRGQPRGNDPTGPVQQLDLPAEPISIHGAGGSASREKGATTEARSGRPLKAPGTRGTVGRQPAPR